MKITPDLEWLTEARDFLALESDWDGLWARTADRRFSQTFAWRRLGWETTGAPRGRRPCVLVLRVAGEAVLIWPLAVRRRLLLWRVAGALGPEFTDYDPVLVADGPDAQAYIETAWRALSARGFADVITTPLVRADAPLHGLMSALPGPRAVEILPSPYILWDGFKTWDAYWKSRSKNTKSRVGRRSRRFEELGQVTFGLVEDPAEFAALLDWTLKEKVLWMARMGLANDFMAAPEFKAFLQSLGVGPWPHGRWVMFALKLDGRIVATKMGTLDDRRYEGFIAAQDPDFANYSAGSIILIRALEWLFDRKLSYDFRIGAEPYKLDWSTHDCPTSTYHHATGAWGGVYLRVTAWLAAARAAKDRARERLSPEFRQAVKAFLRSPLSSRRRAKSAARPVEVGE